MKFSKKMLRAGAALACFSAAPALLDAGIITTNQTINTAQTESLFVQSGTVTVNNITLSNLTAQGGNGSGGGAGMGGGVFVNTGAVVTLTNVNFYGNQAIGGSADGISFTGGSLNGLFIDNTGATAGRDGSTPTAYHYLDANGTNGTNGGMGAVGVNGTGGRGGHGGAGGNGDATEAAVPFILDVTSASGNVVALAAEIAGALSNFPPDVGEAIAIGAQVVVAGIDLGNATAALVYYDKAIASGQIGVGGSGGIGGNAGASDFGYGGNFGGNGGNGGNGTKNRDLSAFKGGAAGGDAGDGGTGGLGGFGAGGGSGGNGGNGGAGANVGSIPEVPAIPAETKTYSVDASYQKVYEYDPDKLAWNNTISGQVAGKQNLTAAQRDAAIAAGLGTTTVSYTDASGTTQSVVVNNRVIEDPYLVGVYDVIYSFDPDNNSATDIKRVVIQGSMTLDQKNSAVSSGLGTTTVTYNDGTTGTVSNQILEQTPAYTTTIITKPGQEYIPADPNGTRPNGAKGAGGAGGDGGFGAGAGAGGTGSDPRVTGGNGGSGFGGAIFVKNGGTLTIIGNATFDGNDVRGGNGQAGSSTVAAGAAGSGYGTDMFIMAGAVVTISPGAGNVVTFNGSIADDSVTSDYDTSRAAGNGAGITISGGGLVVFNGENTYSGRTVVNGTVLQAIDGEGVHAQSRIELSNGAIFQSSGQFTRRLGAGITQFTMGDASGFAAIEEDLTVRLNSGSAITWGATTGFVTGELLFGSSSADATVNFVNALNLGGATRTVLVTDNTGADTDIAVLSGVISNGSLTVGNATHTGVLRLDAANTYTGDTTVTAGTLALGATGSLSTGNVIVNGTFDISGAGNRTVGTLSGSGTVALGANTLTVNQGADATFSGAITDGGLEGGTGGAFTKAGASALTLSGASTYTGATTVSAGTLALSGSLASTAITIASGATLSDTAAGLSDDAVVTANGTLAISGSAETIKTLNGAGAVTLAGDLTVSDGTFSGIISGASGLTKASDGTLTLSGANTFTGAFNANAGTTTLSGSLATATVNVASGATLAVTASGLASGATLTNAGTVTLGADDTVTSLVNSGTLNGAGITLTAATYALNNGSVVNANLGAGAATANGTVALNGTVAANLTVATGTTTLGSAERLADTATVTVAAGATLTLGGAETLGTLNGSGTLNNTAGALTVSSGTFSGDITGTSAVNKVSTGTLTLSGTNTFTGAFNANAGTTTLSGSLATTSVNVASGATLTDSNGGLASGATLTNAGTVTLGAADTIAAYVSNAGTLNGTGQTLTAATYALNTGSVVNANLGTGSLTANGTVALNGTSDASSVTIATGTTTLGSAERLVDTASVTIASGATLTLGGAETITSINGAGTLNNTAGALTVSTGTWAGDITGTSAVNKVSASTLTVTGANSFTGAFNANAGTTTLVGSLATNSVNIASGATLRDINGGLASGATVTNAGILDLTASDETITAFVSNGGTLNFTQTYTPVTAAGPDVTVTNPGTPILIGVDSVTGAPIYTTTASTTTTVAGPAIIVGSTPNAPAKLTALTYALNNGTVINANLGTGTLTANGSVALNGTADAATVNIVSGTTTLGSAERLADTATVTVSSGATLTLGGAETIGTLNGAGTVNNTAGALTVSSGTWAGDITGSSAVNKVSAGTLTLTGANSFTGAFNANAGTTTLSGSGSLATNAVNVAVGATLNDNNGGLAATAVLTNNGTVNLGASETITTLNGTAATAAVNLGANTLTVSDGAYAGAINGTGTLVKTSSGTLTLSGNSGQTGPVSVNAGTLELTGTTASTTVTIAAGATLLDTNGGLAANATVNNHGTLTLGANETITTLNGASTGVVNLGANTLTVSDGAFAGAINGTGGLVKNTAGTLTLSGASGYTGTTDINAGVLQLTGSLASLTVNVASGASLNDVNGGLAAGATLVNAGTVTLSADDTIDTYVSNGGVLNVAGFTLTTRNYLLNTGTVTNANLGTGNVTTNGTVTINGTSDAATFTVASGTTTLGSAERLNDTGTVVINSGATLVLGGVETIGTLNGSGTLNNTAGALTVSAGTWAGDITGSSAVNKASAGTLTLSGANTFTGAFNANAGTTVLSGSLATTTLNIASGATFTDVNGGLVDATVATVNGTLTLSGAGETITTLNGASSGVVNVGGGFLTVSNGTFAGAINGAQGLVKNTAGTLTLSGSSGYTGTTDLNAGTLTLTGSTASRSVNVASGASLNDVNGGLAADATLTNAGTVTLSADDTIGAYVANSGTLAGAGRTLTAATYALNNGAVVNANLGTGSLTANGTVALNGTSAASAVTISSGTTTLGSAERLADTASVTIASGASLILGGAETIGSLNGAGTLNNTAGTLTVSSGSFAGVITGGSDVRKVSSGTLELAGANTFTGLLAVNAGTVTLTGSLATNFITVASGATLNDVNAGLAATASVSNAGVINVTLDDTIDTLNNTGVINGPGTLTAAVYNLGNGSVINANLGSGTLVVTDAAILNGTSAATLVDITPTGTLTLGSAERLLDTAVVNVNGALILGGAETIGSLTGSGSVNLAAGNLTVSSGSFSGVLSGANGLTKVSSGSLTLDGANTFAGAFNANGGTTTLNGSLATLTVNVASGASLNVVNGGLAAGATLTNAGTVSLFADDTIATYVSENGVLNLNGFTLTAANYVLNDGSVTNANLGAGNLITNGTVAINGTSSATSVTIASGTTTLGSAERLADTATLTVSSGASLVLGGAETVTTLLGSGSVTTAPAAQFTVSDGTFSGTIAGDGGLTKVSSGSLTLSGANTYTGDTRVNAGALELTGSLAGAPVFVASGATLVDRSGGLADTTRLTLDGTLDLYASESVADFSGAATGRVNLIDGGMTASAGTFAGVIAGDSTEFGLTKVSVGTLTLSGHSTFIGTARVAEGTLVLTGDLDTAAVTVDSGATLDVVNAGLAASTVLTAEGAVLVRSAESVYTLRSTGATGVVSLLGGDLTVSNGDYAGAIAGTDPAHGLEKISVGELTLRGASTFVGETHVAGGTLTLTGAGALASALVTIDAGTTLRDLSGGLADTATVVNRGTLDLGTLADDTIGTLVNSGTVNGTTTLTASTYALNSGSVINANLGAGVVTANGTVRLNGTVTAADVTIASGTTTLGSAERLADTATITVASGATLATGGAEQIGVLLGSGRLNVSAGSLAADSGSFSGVIASDNTVTGFTKTGAGVLTLSGSSTYLGLTTVSGGELVLTGTLASKSLVVGPAGTLTSESAGLSEFASLDNAGVVNLGAADETLAAYASTGTLNGSATLTAATYALNEGSVVNANLGAGSLTANGTVALNGTSAAASVTVDSGTTTLGSAERLLDTAALTVNGTLVLGGAETVASLAGTGAVNTDAGILTVSSGSFSGDITGASGLVKTSSGMLVLSGANTFSGPLSVQAGALGLSGSLATTSVTVDSGASLSDLASGLSADAAVAVNGVLYMGASDAIRTLTGSGAVLLDGGFLAVADGDFSGNLSGANDLVKNSTGTLTLSGANTYTGLTAINEGALRLTGSLASSVVMVASSGTLTNTSGALADTVFLSVEGRADIAADETVAALAGSGVVDLSGSTRLTVSLGDFSGVVSGTGSLTKSGTSILTLSGANTYTGATAVNSGTLRLTGSLTSTEVSVASGAVLESTASGLSTAATLTNAGTVNLGSADQTVLSLVNSGVLNGSATLTAAAYDLRDGSVINANLGKGAMFTTGAVMLAGTSASGAVTIGSGSVLTLASADRLSDEAVVTVDGRLVLTGDDTIWELHGNGSVDGGANSKLYILNGGTFGGTILKGTRSLTSEGDTSGGTLVLSEKVTLVGGRLQIVGTDASLSANTLQVEQGATLATDDASRLTYKVLQGSGTVSTASGTFTNAAGSTVAGTLTFSGNFSNNGTVAPGNSPGVMTVAGNFADAGVLDMELGGLGAAGMNPTGFDQIRVGGDVTLSGGVLRVLGYNGFAAARGQSFRLISDLSGGAKALSGSFSSVTFDLDGVAGPGVPVQNAAGVFDLRTGTLLTSGLNAANSKFTDLAASANERAFIGAVFAGAQLAPGQIDTATAEGRAAADILSAPTAAAASAQLAFYIPETYGALADYAFASGRLAENLANRVSPFTTLPGREPGKAAFYAGALNAETNTAHNARFTRNDFYAGADFAAASSLDLGLFGAGNTGSIRHDIGRTEAEGASVGAYAKAAISENWSIKASFVYGTEDFETKRRTLNGSVNADTKADTYSGALMAEYVAFRGESFSIAPRAGVVAGSSTVYAFTERGASDALRIGEFDTARYSARAGASAVWTTRTFGNPLSLELTGDLDQAFAGDQDDLSASLAGTPSLTYPIGVSDERSTSFLYGVNAGYGLTESASLFLGYQGRVGYAPSNSVQASVRFRF